MHHMEKLVSLTMAGYCISLLWLLLICALWGEWRNFLVLTHQGCYLRHFKFVPPVHGRYLVGHVFRNFSIGMYSECEKRCVWERECLSVNIGPPIHEKVVCELSNSDHVQHPEDLKPRQGWTYRGTENVCRSNPCSNGGKCQIGHSGDQEYLCVCQSGYTGKTCEKVLPCGEQEGWTLILNKCIKYVDMKMSWLEANATCSEINGNLVVFHTAQELLDVANSVLPSTYIVWIGLTDLKTSRVWKWVDSSDLTFDQWRVGEPSSVNENCVLLVNGVVWNILWNHNFNDGVCTGNFNFICEKAPRGLTK